MKWTYATWCTFYYKKGNVLTFSHEDCRCCCARCRSIFQAAIWGRRLFLTKVMYNCRSLNKKEVEKYISVFYYYCCYHYCHFVFAGDFLRSRQVIKWPPRFPHLNPLQFCLATVHGASWKLKDFMVTVNLLKKMEAFCLEVIVPQQEYVNDSLHLKRHWLGSHLGQN